MDIDPFLKNVNAYVLNPAIELLIGVAVVMFIWGVVEFVWKSDDEEHRQSGAQHILWGLIGLAIMVSAIAIKGFIQNTVGGF